MPEFISGNPDTVKILFEGMVTNPRFSVVQEHDGEGQDYQPAGGKSINSGMVHTKRFRIWYDGKPTAINFKIIYNKRDDWSDIRISWFNLMELKTLQMMGSKR